MADEKKSKSSGVAGGSGATGGSAAKLTVEEHAKKMKLSGPIFAGVMESQRWAPGKRVEKTEFEKAVRSFLDAPQGGRR